jgi:hypothetical protein
MFLRAKELKIRSKMQFQRLECLLKRFRQMMKRDKQKNKNHKRNLFSAVLLILNFSAEKDNNKNKVKFKRRKRIKLSKDSNQEKWGCSIGKMFSHKLKDKLRKKRRHCLEVLQP